MRKLSSFDLAPGGHIRRWLRGWLLPALLALGAAPAARAQCSFSVSATPAGPVALCAGGSTTLTAAATVPGFNVGGSGVGGVVHALVKLPNGKTLVGGSLSTYNGSALASRNLIRLNADGSLDNTFNVGGSGFNTQVNAVALQADGKIVVGGFFTSYNGVATGADRLTRLNADGSRDTSFNPVLNSSGNVYAVSIQADGKILAAGSQVPGDPTTLLARLNANGSADNTFSFVPFNSTTGEGLNGSIMAMTLQADGKIVLAGILTYYSAYYVLAENGMVRLNTDGSLDAAFNPSGTGISGAGSFLLSVAVQADGKILAGGNFTSYNGSSVAVPDNLVRLNADGSLDTAFNPAGAGFEFNGAVYALVPLANGKILVGGHFDTYNGDATVPNKLLQINANGSVDNTFNTGGEGGTAGLGYGIRAIALQPDGRIVAGGSFNNYNNSAPGVHENIIQVNADGSPNNAATPATGVTYAWSNGATGASLIVTQPGTYVASATSGGCTSYSNTVTVNAAPAVTVSVTPVGPVALPAGGSQVLTATAVVPAFNATGNGFNGRVNAVLPLPNGQTLVGGVFNSYNGSAVPRGLVRLNADGSRDASFNGANSGFGIEVRCLALQADGKVLVGGDFNTYNGTTVPWGLVRLNTDGSRDASFNGSSAGFNVLAGAVLTLSMQPDGKVLVGGVFTQYNAANVPRGIIRLNTDGSRDTGFNGNNTGVDGGSVSAIAVQPDGRILIGGLFSDYNGEEPTGGTPERVPNGLIRLNANGSRDITFNTFTGSNLGFTGAASFSGSVSALALQPDGKVLAGGSIALYNGSRVPSGLTRLNADGSYDASFNGANATTGAFILTVGSNPVFGTGRIYALALQPDGKVLAGGEFQDYNQVEFTTSSTTIQRVPDHLIRLNTDGSRDGSFNGTNTGFNGFVRALGLSASGKVLAGGEFTAYNGNAAAPDYLFGLDGSGSLNTSATSLPNATYTWSPGNSTGSTLSVSTAGSYTATATNPATGCTYTSNTVVVTAAPAPDLVVSTPAGIPAGTYNNVTITGTGIGTLQGDVTVNGTLLVQTSGQLLSGCFTLSGPGAVTVAAGAMLAICSSQGLSTAAGTGTVQTTGARSLSPDAIYLYNGTAAQQTGNGLPATVRELALSNATGLTLTQALQVSQRVQLLSGNLTLNGQALTLLSSATGTALIDNAGGLVLGATGTMQRYIETNAAASGYRHYSSPVQGGAGGETVGTLATAGYVPNFGGAVAYNSSPTPGLVTPFPTVFTYNQDRIATTTSNYAVFDKGWEAVTSGTDPMQAGRGYAVNAPGAALVDFTGTFTSGSVSRANLQRASADPATGWHLLGNPFPAPLDWSTMTLGTGQNLENMDGAVYVFQSSGPYTGTYRTYLAAAPGSNSPLIPAGSGFFVHASTPGTPGLVRFAAPNRVTSFGAQPAFGRQTSTAPAVLLTLTGAAGADALTLYADPAATAGLDATYDALKLANPSGLNLAALTATGEALAIDGRAGFSAATVVPLRVETPVAGPYTLAINVANLPAGLAAYLRDATTGQQVSLGAQTSIPVALGAGLSTRYSVVFAPAGPLATAAGLTAAQVLLYPNPTSHGASITVSLPVPAGTSQARATVLNALGQVVSIALLPVQAGQATGPVATAGLAAGVYVVRLQAGANMVSKRLVVN